MLAVQEGGFEFVFKDSFHEMLTDFKIHSPEMVANDKKIPYDWTLYYLRKKALTQKIDKEELAWLLLHFNQKRGYYQLRGEEESDNPSKREDFLALKVVKVEDSGEKKGKDSWYNIHLENGMLYRRASATLPDKEGKIKRSFRAPKEDDWKLLKKKTEADIEKSGNGRRIYLRYPVAKSLSKNMRQINPHD